MAEVLEGRRRRYICYHLLFKGCTVVQCGQLLGLEVSTVNTIIVSMFAEHGWDKRLNQIYALYKTL